jgi:hypothetical protein
MAAGGPLQTAIWLRSAWSPGSQPSKRPRTARRTGSIGRIASARPRGTVWRMQHGAELAPGSMRGGVADFRERPAEVHRRMALIQITEEL